MVMDLLNTILKDLEQYLNITDLHTDKNESCRIVYNNGFEVQLELDPSGEFVCVGTKIGVVPKGKYRNQLFKEALKMNGLPAPRYGTFAFSEKNNMLIFFDYVWAKELSGEKLSAFLKNFREKALVWKEALGRGEVPEFTQIGSKAQRPKGMFGL